jgi:hypothetical protein
MKKDIYRQHEATFSNVSAFVIMREGERVATVALKFPKDGAGRLWVYVHFLGVPMVRDYAGGYGYDKRSHAVTHAAGKIKQIPLSGYTAGQDWAEKAHIAEKERLQHFIAALSDIGGKDWVDALRDAGYTVMQAV